ncbi:MAG TPA: class II fumarate hydratase [Halanaerobiales bacterium]|nr:class II fumarate hydratase [Halanaerobiales bacterium]
MEFRVEKDSIGEVKVPKEVYYGAQTQRALDNFAISNEKIPIEVIKAYGFIKKAAALVNNELGLLDDYKKDLIIQVCDEIIEGKHDEQFPVRIWQSGSGTQTNMNVNEVISNRAIELAGGKKGSKKPIHPNDHVNMSQSTNDTFPTAMNISSVKLIKNSLILTLKKLKNSLHNKSREFEENIKVGRTHLMDATPITLGQEFTGYESQIEHGIKTLESSLFHLKELAIGGTAVGTGLNTPRGYSDLMVNKISALIGINFVNANNKFESIASHDGIVEASGALKTIATSLIKIANDIRWLSSGPRCGINEINIPANEPGSSIMPGKVNPSQAEALIQGCFQVIGNDNVITNAGSSGNFELNVCKPLIIYNFIQSIKILSDSTSSFTQNCINGIVANKENMEYYFRNSVMLVTALSPIIGYDKAAKIAEKAYKEDITLKEATVELGYLSEEEFDKKVKPENMISPGLYSD